MNSVVIEKFRFALRISRRDAGEVQARCRALFCGSMMRQFTESSIHFKKYDSRIYNVRLDKLTLHIGEISLSQFETQLMRQTASNFIRILMDILRKSTVTSDSGDRVTGGGVANDADDGINHSESLRENSKPDFLRIVDTRTPAREISNFLSYLDTGYLAQPERLHTPSQTDRVLNEYLNRVCSFDDPSTRIEVALRCLNPRARHRLVMTFSDATLWALCAWLTEHIGVDVPIKSNWARVLSLSALRVLQLYPALVQTTTTRLPVIFRPTLHPLTNTQLTATGHEITLLTSDVAEVALLRDLLSAPLTEPVRSQLNHVLATTPGTVNRATTWLAELSPALRKQLTVALGLRAPRPTLHLKSTLKRSTKTDARPAPQQSPEPRATVLDLDEPLSVPSGGLALLWPMLPRLFEALELTHDADFIDEAARYRAVALLDWLAWGISPAADWRLPVPRVLCGLAPLPDDSEPFEWPTVDVAKQAYLDSWLNTTLSRLPDLSRLSVNDLRELFLQRPGSLIRKNEHWQLAVEHEAQDMLLRGLTWPLTIAALPWLSQPLPIQWVS